MQRQIAEFLDSAVTRKAFAGLADSARVLVRVEGIPYGFVRESGRFILSGAAIDPHEGAPLPDMEFFLPEGAVARLLLGIKPPDARVSDLGKLAFDLIFSNNPQEKVAFRIHASLFTLVRKGYFSVLIAAGPEVFAHLQRYGFGNLAKVKKILQQNRSRKE